MKWIINFIVALFGWAGDWFIDDKEKRNRK